MSGNSQCFVEWKEQYVSKEKGKRVVHYFLKDIAGKSVLAVVGTERSIRHMFYVVAEEFLKVNEAENSVIAGYRWRSRREVVNWLTSMLSKQHRQSELLKSPKSDYIPGVGASYHNRVARSLKLRTPDIVWSGDAWACSKQLKHFPTFCRNGITIAVHSFVFVMAEEEKRYLAYLEDMYEDKKGQKKVKVRWFHHNQEVQAVITIKNPHPKEVFITPYTQVISVECVDGPAIVLTREHYEKYVYMLPEDLLSRVHLCFRQFKNNRVKPFKMSKLCGYVDQPIFSILETGFDDDDEEFSNGENVKVGDKRPRSSRGRQVAPCDSFYMNVKFEILRRKLIPKYVKTRDSYKPCFKVNEKIEVLCEDSGIRGCWFRCTVIKVNRRQLKVKYDDLKDEGGSGNLEEWVPAFRSVTMPDKLGMRCAGRSTTRPACTDNENSVVAFEVGSPVDAWWSDGWWEGVITGLGESVDADAQVYVPSENLFLEVHKKNIRVSRDWMNDVWVDLETKPNVLSLMPAVSINEKTPAGTSEIKHDSVPSSSKEIPAPVDPPEPVDPSEPLDHELHEKEKDPSSAHDDNHVQVCENGERTSDKEVEA
ncbi:uncharacterized protein [Rutidosis leptorrhynchoides]|uniref:uncharacterized protein n=1 Tax=Rutidosis leptorrhynchoides TaxID=125765 RepID=UPI003A9964B4